jgi:hypothetical protein
MLVAIVLHPVRGSGQVGANPFHWATNATYLGSFKLPACKKSSCGTYTDSHGQVVANASFNTTGEGLAYDATNHALVVSCSGGNVKGTAPSVPMYTAEVTIPAMLGTGNPHRWPTAKLTVINGQTQTCHDPTEGAYQAINAQDNNQSKVVIGGYLVEGPDLYVTEYIYYDAANLQTVSHFKRPLNLNIQGRVTGPYGITFPLTAHNGVGGNLSDYDRWWNGWCADIPPAWQSALAGNVICGTTSKNISGGTSNGPDAFAWNTSTWGPNIVGTPLLYYTTTHPMVAGGFVHCFTNPPIGSGQAGAGQWGPTADGNCPGAVSTTWNGLTRMAQGLIMPGSRTFAFFERVGAGTQSTGCNQVINGVVQAGTTGGFCGGACYGMGEKLFNPPSLGYGILPATGGPNGFEYCYSNVVGDSGHGSRANIGPPYEFHILEYDLNDLTSVAAGTMLPYGPIPYENVAIHLPQETDYNDVLGVALDVTNQMLYISQGQHGNPAYIHVYILTTP